MYMVSIITKLFPTEKGFFNGPVSQFGGARADLFTLHSVLSFKTHEKNFFVVEYRPPGDEPDTDAWTTAVEELRQYLGGISEGNSNSRIFGAIAIFRAVRFYELNDGYLCDLNGDGSIYYLDRQCKTITEKLKYIRTHCEKWKE